MYKIIILSMFLGIFSGTLAGFFGIGGGVILVPILLLCFKILGFSQDIIMHITIGTSLSCIFFTALSSVWTHHKNNNVDWTVFKKLVIGIAIGSILGSTVASSISSHSLEIIFAIYLTFIFLTMSLKSHKDIGVKKISTPIYSIVGSVIGFKSTILGIGGGTISIPFLSWTGKKMKEAVGISASIGLPISLFGCLSYIYNGYGQLNLPEYSFGYIYLPAFLGIISTSQFFARVGAKLSSTVSQKTLRKSFILFLFIILMKTYYEIFFYK